MADAELEKLVAEDERRLQPDWTQARLVLPQAKLLFPLGFEPGQDFRVYWDDGQKMSIDAAGWRKWESKREGVDLFLTATQSLALLVDSRLLTAAQVRDIKKAGP